MRNLFLKLILLSPILLGLVATNYSVDPAHLFSDDNYVQGIAQILLSGKNVGNLKNYDQGLLQEYYSNGLTQPKKILVLGSSRSMQIRAETFASHSFFNTSVGGATLDDLMAIYEMYHQKGLKPSMVIINLDPWYLNSALSYEDYPSLRMYYDNIAQRAGIVTPSGFDAYKQQLDQYLQLVSPSYFQAAIRAIYGGRKEDNYYATDDRIADRAMKLADGSLVYDQVTRTQTVAQVQKKATSEAEDLKSAFTILDQVSKRKLESFTNLVQSSQVKVVFVLVPFHPYVYNYWSSSDRYLAIIKAQRYFEELGRKKHIAVLGSYNPLETQCGESEFFDGTHPKETCLVKILAGVSDLPGNAQ